MKKNILLSVALFAILGMANAQKINYPKPRSTSHQTAWKIYQENSRLVVSTYAERTHIGPKAGTGLGVEFRNLMSVGLFYQESEAMMNFLGKEEPNDMSIDYEKQFYGVYYSLPLSHRDAFDLDFKIRTGVSNGENFVITPSIHSSLTIAHVIQLQGGIGMRSFRPTVMTGVNIKL